LNPSQVYGGTLLLTSLHDIRVLGSRGLKYQCESHTRRMYFEYHASQSAIVDLGHFTARDSDIIFTAPLVWQTIRRFGLAKQLQPYELLQGLFEIDDAAELRR